MKYNLNRVVRTGILATALTLVNPLIIKAANDTYFGKTKEEWIDSGKKVVDWASEIDEKINEKVVEPIKEEVFDPAVEWAKQKEFIKASDLWLITSIPEKNPDNKRNYYFVYNRFPKSKKTTYYDSDGNVVKENGKVYKRIEKSTYLTVFGSGTYTAEMVIYYRDNRFETNYIDLDEHHFFDEDTTASYGRVVNWEALIPNEMRKESYSSDDLENIILILNDLDYSLVGEHLGRRK